ncbi:MAG: hypothetical protein GXO00_02715, partial [Candidatus Diapherotrites archaeon]|nr:hypothetical protein [Candidatus Diapherotrites archaeon]
MRLLKIGGALITDKTKPYTPRPDVIEAVAAAIARAYGERFIVAHGGGSFPHVSAKEYDVVGGIRDERSRFGAGVVHYDATWINQIFMKALHEKGVPAMSFHPNSFLFSSGGKKVKAFLEPIFEALRWKLVPVVYGDAVLDAERGVTAFSSEKVLFAIAEEINEPVVIGMAEMVDGIYTADPLKDPSAEHIPRVDRNNYREVLSMVGGSHGVDVTGGMAHKLEVL